MSGGARGVRRRAALAAILGGLALDAGVVAAQPRRPIIDMHLHAHALADYGGGMPACGNRGPVEFPPVDPRNGIGFGSQLVTCPPSSVIPPATSDEALLRETLAMLERHDVVLAVTTGTVERVSRWRAASDRIVPATYFDVAGTVGVERLRRLVASDSVRAFAEVGPQYDGASADDRRLAAFFALAEELDVPVGIHLGEGPPGGAHTLGGSPYQVRLGSPLQLEAVLLRHPKLRLWVMHFGSPFVDEMIAMLFSHPQLHVDVAANDWGFPRAQFYGQLERMVDAGFAKRILWGSDQMIWPGAIPVAIETIEQAPFLTEEQKRDILYHNAARFLRLSAAEIARHHGR